MIQLMLDNQSPLNATDISGLTALHHCQSCHLHSTTSINRLLAISEGHGDAAMLLLRCGVETDKRDADRMLAIDTAPEKKV